MPGPAKSAFLSFMRCLLGGARPPARRLIPRWDGRGGAEGGRRAPAHHEGDRAQWFCSSATGFPEGRARATGLGQEAGGEGLIGIQRAFQVSGARRTLASLWKVDNLITKGIMIRFYRNMWEKDMSEAAAIREAQLWLLKNPDQMRGLGDALKDENKKTVRTPPYYWAAWVLSGDSG